MTHGVGNNGNMFHLGVVGSNAGRTACNVARGTRATSIAMDPIDRRDLESGKYVRLPAKS